MAITLSAEQVRRLHLRAQRLDPRTATATHDVAQVVREVVGLQAQDAAAWPLGVRVRSRGLVAADVERARFEERSIVRTWCQRGTLHLLAADDLGWLLPLIGPAMARQARPRRLDLGLDDETTARGVRLMREILAGQRLLTRTELVERLAACGLPLAGQARPHLIQYAALNGIVCLGPEQGRETTCVLLEDWLPHPPAAALSREAALAELARRYLAAYGPATPEDLAAWSGLPMRDARDAWSGVAAQIMEVEVASRPAWMLQEQRAWLDAPPPREPLVRLLPRFDTYLLGHRRRDLILVPGHTAWLDAANGMIPATLLVDGQVLGIWTSERRKNKLRFTVEPFEPLDAALHEPIGAETADVARFLGLEAEQPVTIMAP